LTKQKIVIIGAGKIAYSITSALVKSGYNVQCTISRKLSSAKLLANKFSIPHHADSISKISDEIDIYFLTVPDGEIKKVAEKLSRLKRDFSKSMCLHFSGVENITSLRTLANKGCGTGSLHIMQTFPSTKTVELKNSSAALEADDKKVYSFLNQLCKKLRLESFRINSDEKVLYHLAGVYSSNFLVGNLFTAFSLFKSKNKKQSDLFKSTSYATLKNIFELNPAKSLSGPIDRGDIYTIRKHISELDDKIKSSKNNQLKLLRKNYLIQSLSLLEVVKVKYGKLNEKHLEIKKLLKKQLA
jgi:predicted short-subunit dehydrogenase-like oxidoreductase (DUF2520 family)